MRAFGNDVRQYQIIIHQKTFGVANHNRELTVVAQLRYRPSILLTVVRWENAVGAALRVCQ